MTRRTIQLWSVVLLIWRKVVAVCLALIIEIVVIEIAEHCGILRGWIRHVIGHSISRGTLNLTG
jgi:hypothetical protein